ncbi:MAG: hypothetical protein COC05_00175 [Gammaproteobacteria bacterium]|nr:MAG: hypothetical protein COC05_00175 [Gammaproteobacteria bacterium]
MKALLITPATKSVEIVDVSSLDDIKAMIGFDTIDSDEVGPEGDRLYFDEECFIRGDAVTGRFQVDKVMPVAGKGMLVGSADGGISFKDVVTDVDALKERLVYL